MAPDSKRDRLPFEPSSNRKQPPQSPDTPQGYSPASQNRGAKGGKVADKAANTAKKSSSSKPASSPASSREDTSIPQVVSRRMLKRMALFSGTPTFFGVFIFFASYVLLTQGIVEFPKVVVLLSTLLCFGLGVVGLSYGALSASWDEEASGSPLGWAEFRLNFGRMTSAWRDQSESSSQSE